MLLDLAAGEGIALDAILADTALGAPGDRPIPLIGFDGHADAHALLADLERAGVAVFSDHVALDSDADLESGDDAREPVREPGVDVLVVEDNQINQFVFTQILEALGLSQRIVATAREGIDAWLELRPRLVFVDISLPDMDPYDMVGKIRTLEAATGSQTPIVLVANGIEAFDPQRAQPHGVHDHLMKPLSPDAVEIMYRRHVPVKVGREGTQP